VIERDPQRTLQTEVLQQAQQKALQDWVEGQKSSGVIEIFVQP
jgi:hypothetical protein